MDSALCFSLPKASAGVASATDKVVFLWLVLSLDKWLFPQEGWAGAAAAAVAACPGRGLRQHPARPEPLEVTDTPGLAARRTGLLWAGCTQQAVPK